MNTTADTQREVRTLAPCDTTYWNAEGEKYVADKAAACESAEELAKLAGAIANTEEAKVDKHRPIRDEAAFSIAAHYRVRRGAGLADALGVNRTRLKAMKDKYAAGRGYGSWDQLTATNPAAVSDVPDAPKVLEDHATKVARANGRFAAARDVRDAAVRELLAMQDEDGNAVWKNVAVSTLIGVDPSRVSHIKHGTKAKSRSQRRQEKGDAA